MILTSYKTFDYSLNSQMQMINYAAAQFHLSFCKSIKEKSINVLMSDLSKRSHDRIRNIQIQMDKGRVNIEVDENYHALKTISNILLITEEMIHKGENQSLSGIMLRLIPGGIKDGLSLSTPSDWQKIQLLDSLFFPFDINHIYCRTRKILQRIPNQPPIVLWDWVHDPFDLSIPIKFSESLKDG